MKNLIDRLMDAARKYNVWDFGLFKITLCSLGILLGAYFATFFLKYIALIWGIFIASYAWIAYKTFIKYKEE